MKWFFKSSKAKGKFPKHWVSLPLWPSLGIDVECSELCDASVVLSMLWHKLSINCFLRTLLQRIAFMCRLWTRFSILFEPSNCLWAVTQPPMAPMALHCALSLVRALVVPYYAVPCYAVLCQCCANADPMLCLCSAWDHNLVVWLVKRQCNLTLGSESMRWILSLFIPYICYDKTLLFHSWAVIWEQNYSFVVSFRIRLSFLLLLHYFLQ